ncbi:MAG: hypothetical protein AAB322_00495, partial [Pseudomonadota bacterium]
VMPLNSDWVFSLICRLRRRHSAILGMLITLLAQVHYRYAFERRMGLVWIRRIYLGLRMILAGEARALLAKAAVVLARPKYSPPTGRISAR